MDPFSYTNWDSLTSCIKDEAVEANGVESLGFSDVVTKESEIAFKNEQDGNISSSFNTSVTGEGSEIPLSTDKVAPNKKPFLCDFCERRFKTKTSLKKHMAVHLKSHEPKDDLNHSKNHYKKPFICQYCGLEFAREKTLITHAKVHSGSSPLACHKCNQSFWDRSSMEEHWKIRHSNIRNYSSEANQHYPHSCITCGESFNNLLDLNEHQRHHMEEELINNSQLRHMCDVCGQSFREALHLLAHAEVHISKYDYRCSLCEEEFIDQKSYSEHSQKQHPLQNGAFEAVYSEMPEETKFQKKDYKCDVSMEDFSDRVKYKRNHHIPQMQKNISGLQFPCTVCGKIFASRNSHQIHIRIHTGERPYSCQFCHKSFADGGTLRKHERIHTGEKPYKCVICSKAFNQRVVLREHINTMHSSPDPRYEDSVTPFCCSVCMKMFVTSQECVSHLIQHCDSNTAMNRTPQMGPRKYTRRKKLSPDPLYNEIERHKKQTVLSREFLPTERRGPRTKNVTSYVPPQRLPVACFSEAQIAANTLMSLNPKNLKPSTETTIVKEEVKEEISEECKEEQFEEEIIYLTPDKYACDF